RFDALVFIVAIKNLVICIASQLYRVITITFTQSFIDWRKSHRLIDVIQNSIDTLNLFCRVRKYQIFYLLSFVFFEIMNHQVDILVEVWLRMGIKVDNLICFKE